MLCERCKGRKPFVYKDKMQFSDAMTEAMCPECHEAVKLSQVKNIEEKFSRPRRRPTTFYVFKIGSLNRWKMGIYSREEVRKKTVNASDNPENIFCKNFLSPKFAFKAEAIVHRKFKPLYSTRGEFYELDEIQIQNVKNLINQCWKEFCEKRI